MEDTAPLSTGWLTRKLMRSTMAPRHIEEKGSKNSELLQMAFI